MAGLLQDECKPCEKEMPPLTDAETHELKQELLHWTLEPSPDGCPCLTRTFKFKDFRQTVNFAVLAANRADQANHHPQILLDYGKAQVRWWTHHNRSLNRNDFIMAAKTDEIYDAKAWERTLT